MPHEALDIRLEVNLPVPDIALAVDRRWKNVEIGVDRGGAYHVPYEGEYHVTPKLYWQQRLETYNKYMSEDVLVDAIRVTETSNPQGGKTIVIG